MDEYTSHAAHSTKLENLSWKSGFIIPMAVLEIAAFQYMDSDTLSEKSE